MICTSDGSIVVFYEGKSGREQRCCHYCLCVLLSAPSRRSDLQSLGYCMLRWHTGTLPWTDLIHPDQVATQKQRWDSVQRQISRKMQMTQKCSLCRYMEDVPALLRHCFGKKRVSSELKCFLFTLNQMCDYTSALCWCVCVSHCRCISSIPGYSDDSAVLWAAGLLCTEGQTQCCFAAARGVTGEAAQILGEYRNNMHLCVWSAATPGLALTLFIKLTLQNMN